MKTIFINILKKLLKTIPLYVYIRRKLWLINNSRGYYVKLNTRESFPAFRPSSRGKSKDLAKLTIQSINQTFPLIDSLLSSLSINIPIISVDEFSKRSNNHQPSMDLKVLFDQYGSDKASLHDYHLIYGTVLSEKISIENILEVGMGTNNLGVASNMGKLGKPGASLRAFRDFCVNAEIYGADIDKQILFSEERITTFYVDQTDSKTFQQLKNSLPKSFDLVIDDGLHSPNANIATLDFGLQIIKKSGWVIVEDINVESLSIWKVIYYLISENFEPFIIQSKSAFVFAAKRKK
jgi:hypothetical protein